MLRLCVFLAIFSIKMSSAFASITIDRTRVIFDATENVASFTLNNSNDNNSLVQIWIDDGNIDKSPSLIDVPFVVSPQIKEINANQSQVIKVKFIGDSVPVGEALYWLNVLEVPQKGESGDNYIQLAYRTRIKLFLRSSEIKNLSQAESSEKLKFKLIKDGVMIRNDSPFHITLSNLKLLNDGDSEINVEGFVINPDELKEVKINNAVSFRKLEYSYINDWGGEKKVSVVP